VRASDRQNVFRGDPLGPFALTIIPTCRPLPPVPEVAGLFDHFVGAHQKGFGDREAKRLRGGEIDDKIELGQAVRPPSSCGKTPTYLARSPSRTGIPRDLIPSPHLLLVRDDFLLE